MDFKELLNIMAMTQEIFNFVKNHFSKFEGEEVEYKKYIPSADKHVTRKGIIIRIGKDILAECFIVADMGSEYAIHYKDVCFINEKNK